MSTHESNGTTDSMEQPSLALPKRFARCIERLTDGASEEEISEIREELQLVERLNTRDRRTEDDEQRISRHIWQNRSDDIADGDSECALIPIASMTDPPLELTYRLICLASGCSFNTS
jgi:hypothetical protein